MTDTINSPQIEGISALQDELHRARQALIEEGKYRTLFETIPQGIILWDQQGRVATANPAAQSILGLSVEQLQKLQEWHIIGEDGSAYSSERWPVLNVLETGQSFINVVFAVVSEKQGRRWLKVSTIPQFIPG